MNFTRGLDAKSAMGIGVDKCKRCHAVINQKDTIERTFEMCTKCMHEILRDTTPKVTKQEKWHRILAYMFLPFTLLIK